VNRLLPPAHSKLRHLHLRWVGLIFALLLLQQWGLVHRYVHGAPRTGITAQAAATSALAVGVTKAFPAHEVAECLLLDQLCMGDAAPFQVFTVPLVGVVALVFEHSASAFVARWSALFQARGPPLLQQA